MKKRAEPFSGESCTNSSRSFRRHPWIVCFMPFDTEFSRFQERRRRKQSELLDCNPPYGIHRLLVFSKLLDPAGKVSEYPRGLDAQQRISFKPHSPPRWYRHPQLGPHIDSKIPSFQILPVGKHRGTLTIRQRTSVRTSNSLFHQTVTYQPISLFDRVQITQVTPNTNFPTQISIVLQRPISNSTHDIVFFGIVCMCS